MCWRGIGTPRGAELVALPSAGRPRAQPGGPAGCPSAACFSVFSTLIFILKIRAILILCWGDPTHRGVLGPQNEGCLRSRAPTRSGGNYFHTRLSLGCCWYVQTSDSALALIKTMSVASCLPHELHFRLIWRLASCHGALDTGASYKDLK